MKKLFVIFGIVIILVGSIFVTTALGSNIEEDFEEINLKWKAFIAIGRIDICFDEKIMDGLVIIGYNAGETLIFEQVYIEFDGIPILFSNGLLFTFCLYKSI